MQYAILNDDQSNNYYGNIWGVYYNGQYLVTHSNNNYDKSSPWYTYDSLEDFLVDFSFI